MHNDYPITQRRSWNRLFLWYCFIMIVALAVSIYLTWEAFAQVPTVSCSAAQPCTVWWNANTETDLAGYRVYVRKLPTEYGPFKKQILKPQSAIGTQEFPSLGPFEAGEYGLAVTAYDLAGNESEKSNEVFFRFLVPDLPPAPPTIQIQGVTIP